VVDCPKTLRLIPETLRLIPMTLRLIPMTLRLIPMTLRLIPMTLRVHLKIHRYVCSIGRLPPAISDGSRSAA